MNIALVIFPIHASHGCILQTFALATTLRQMGHKVTVIDRQWNKPSFVRICMQAAKVLLKKITCGYAGSFMVDLDKKMILSELQSFINRHLGDREVLYSNPKYEDLKNFNAFIVGSDQTWRPKYVSDVTCYYLGFIPKEANVKRIAYAPSFGTDEWEYSPELTATCKDLVKRFDAVSVREVSGVKLCKDHYGIDAKHVLDPTMLLNREDYLAATDLEMRDDNVLSYYLLDSSKLKMSVVNKVCTEFNMQSIQINTDTENVNAHLRDRIAPSIEKWVGGFAHSRFIVADSFHATVFAIIFNRPFITIANTKRGLSRFESILTIFGLQERMIFDVDDVTDELLHSSIDWCNVNNILNKEQEKSKKFLINNLQYYNS